MKNMRLKILVAFFLTLGSLDSSAQILKSVYFVDGVATRHQLNPAFAPQSGYIGMPGLGNFGLSLSSNVGLGTFLFPNQENELNTFLHKDVGSSEFLDQLNINNNLDINLNLNIIQFGFYAWNGFNSFDINVKSNTYTHLPKDMFAFLKTGMTNPTENNYDFSDVGVNTQNYVDIALGHSRQINDKIRVGVKVKVLLGVVNAYTHFNDLSLSMAEDKWMISGDGELTTSGLKFQTNELDEIIGAEMGDIGLNGLGFAFDLGVTYEPIDNLEVSLAILDLGSMKWNNSVKGGMSGEPFEFNGFNNIDVNNDGGSSFEDQTTELTEDLEALFTFYEMKGLAIENKQSTDMTLNVGAEYSLFNNKLSAGLLSSTIFRKKLTVSDVMLSLNYTPARWFTLTGNASVSNIGQTYGGLMTFSPGLLNFFIGATAIATDFTPQYIPIDGLILNLNFGMNFYIRGNKQKRLQADNLDLDLPTDLPTDLEEIID